MASYNRTRNRRRNTNGNNEIFAPNNSANIDLRVALADREYNCQNTKNYTQIGSVIQEVDDSDTFIELAKFQKGKASLAVYDAKVIVFKNIGNTACELLFVTTDWRNDGGADKASDTTTDVVNSIDRNAENGGSEATIFVTWSMILPAGEFLYLPTSRFIGYTGYEGLTYESAAKSPAGAVSILPSAINSGNEYVRASVFSGSTYASGAGVLVDDGDATATSTELTVDEGKWFMEGDRLRISTEIVEVESISGNNLTFKRALDGSTAVAFTNNMEIHYAFHNHFLKFDNGKCQTDGLGRFKQTGAFFGYGRSADNKIQGVVPGSIAIGPFYTKGGFLNWGLTDVKPSDDTGLTKGDTYAFIVIADEFHASGTGSTTTEVNISFTVDSADASFNGSANAVIPKIQQALDAEFYNASSGLHNKKVTIRLLGGDIQMRSHSNNSDTIVGVAHPSSGTTPFGVGRFPGKGSGGDLDNVPLVNGNRCGVDSAGIMYGPASSLEAETFKTKTGKTVHNTSAFVYDDGNGNLIHNSQAVGSCDYTKGHIQFAVPYVFAEFKINAQTLSAHAGGVNFTNNGQNSLYQTLARSMNTKADGKIEVLLLG